MHAPIRALAVEDNSAWLTQIESALIDSGFEVDKAIDYRSAISLISDRFYYFVAADLALDRLDELNRDGMKILSKLSELGEGTVYVLLSAYGKMEAGQEATRLGALSVIDKSPELRIILRELARKTLATQKVDLPKKYKYGTEFLSATEASLVWTDRALRTLKPKGGIKTLDKLISAVLRGFGPLVHSNSDPIAAIDENVGVITGKYWSKMLAVPIVLMLGRLHELRDKYESYKYLSASNSSHHALLGVRFKAISNVAGCVLISNGLKRSDFLQRLSVD